MRTWLVAIAIVVIGAVLVWLLIDYVALRLLPA